jgi:hypothetical protein
MSTAEFALLVSIFSVVIASLSLGWNIYRDVVLKARVDVSFAVVTLIDQSRRDRPQYLNIKATNFGPGVVTLSTIVVKDSRLWTRLMRQPRYAIITPDYTNPLSAKLPAKLEAGDKIELLLPYDKEAFLKERFNRVGLSDYFGRIHWARIREFKRARETWHKDFGLVKSNSSSSGRDVSTTGADARRST